MATSLFQGVRGAFPSGYGNPVLRFWKAVNKEGSEHPTLGKCWEWLRSLDGDGYGVFSSMDKYVKAHRFSWELHFGEIPDELHVCHDCDNPKCVNPGHLFLGTIQDNNEDRTRKGRSARGEKSGAKTHPEKIVRGTSHLNAKLTDEMVTEIRANYVRGCPHLGTYGLAEIFGVSQRLIHQIVTNKIWTHVK